MTHRTRDPRYYQIACLSALSAYGLGCLDFEIRPAVAAAIVAASLATQWCAGRLVGLERFDPLSPLISALGLCLLLRTPSPATAALAGVVAIGSKFAIRRQGKHVFNPSALALVVLVSVRPDAWVSPGQWGSEALLVFAIACVGGAVVFSARRADVTWAFLAAYGGIVAARSAWLSEPAAVVAHRLESGALLLFAVFMISDPKTTPDSRAGRVLFACLVAAGAAFVHFGLFRNNGFLYALVVAAPLVPLIDRWLPGERYVWGGRDATGRGGAGETHEIVAAVPGNRVEPRPLAA